MPQGSIGESRHMLVGLGNPGREYASNRHNVGFMLIDRLSARLGAPRMRLQSNALVCSTRHEGRPIMLVKPQTYMNLSGQAVQSLARFYRVPLERLLVAHDDLDLPLGTLRLRPGGGPGGQKGVASTIERLGSTGFARLRIGIGRPPGRMDPADYVLQDFARAELPDLLEILDRAADAALAFVLEGIQAAMNAFNGRHAAP
jgi:PTH1 family peptidyl-tRNA hydrolase